jgi:phage-related protein
MPEIKPTIVANVQRALETGEKTSQSEKRQEKILTSVKDGIKTLVQQGKVSFNRTRERARIKLFSSIKKTLEDIKKNTKPDEKKIGMLKLLLLFFAGILLKTVRSFATIIKLFGKGIAKLGLLLKTWTKGLFPAFKRTGIGKFFARISASIGKLFKILSKGTGGFFKMMGKFLKGFVRIFGRIGTLIKALKPVLGILGKILIPITIIMAVIDGLKGLVKATEWFGKKEGELLTFGEKISAVVGSIISGLTLGLLGSGEEMAKGLYKLFSNPKEFMEKDAPRILKRLGERLLNGLKRMGDWIGEAIKKTGEFLLSLGVAMIDFIKKIDWKKVGDAIISSIDSFFKFIVEGIPIVIDKIIDIINRINWVEVGKKIVDILWKGIKFLIPLLYKVFERLVPLLWQTFKFGVELLWTALKGVSQLVLGLLKGIGELIWEGIKTGLEFGWGLISGLGNLIITGISNIFSSIWTSIKDFFTSGIVLLEEVNMLVNDWVNNLANNIITSIKDFFLTSLEIGTGIKDSIIGWMRNLGSHIWGTIKSLFLGSPQDEMKDEVLDSITEWIKGLGKSIWERIKGFFTDPMATLKKWLGVGKEKVIDKVTRIIKGETPQEEEKKTKRRTQAEIREIKSIEKAGGLVLEKEQTETEKTKVFMDFLLNQFADTMAKKIGAETRGEGVANIKEPVIKIF